MPQIAIVIATYNRADLLRLAIESCCQQEGVVPTDYEIIVVDNNCTDHTPQVVAELQVAYPHVALRRVEEPRAGASYARNAALSHSSSPWLAYIDDDAKLPPQYLQVALGLIATLQPSPAVLCGPIRAFTTSPIPPWYDLAWEQLAYDDTAHDLRHTEQFWASNMLLTQDLLRQTNGFPTHVGPAGEDFTILGEESLYIQQLRKLMPVPRMFYAPELFLYHYLPAHKMTVRYRLKRRLAIGQTQLHLDFPQLSAAGRIRTFLAACKGLVILLGRALTNRRRYTYRERWLAEAWGDVAQKIGLMLILLGIRLRLKRSG